MNVIGVFQFLAQYDFHLLAVAVVALWVLVKIYNSIIVTNKTVQEIQTEMRRHETLLNKHEDLLFDHESRISRVETRQ